MSNKDKNKDNISKSLSSFKNYFGVTPNNNNIYNKTTIIQRFKQKMHKNRAFRNKLVISFSMFGK